MLAGLDQLLSAAQNFALMSLAARQLTGAGFGYFALALTVCWLLFGVNLAVVTEPLLVRSGLVRVGGWPRLTGSAVLFTAVSSGLLGLGCLLSAFVLPASLRGSLLAVGLILPVLGVFETVRTAALARLRQGVALLMDSAWVLCWLLALLLLRPSTAAAELLVWGLTCLAGLAVYLVLHAGELGDLRRGLTSDEYRTFSAGLKRLFLLEYLSTSGLAHLFTMAMSAAVGVVAIGGFRAAQAVTGPFNTVLNTLRMVVVPIFSRATTPTPNPTPPPTPNPTPNSSRDHARLGTGAGPPSSAVPPNSSRDHARLGTGTEPALINVPQRYPLGLSAALVAVALAMTAVLLAMPDRIGLALFGVTWPAAAPLVLAVSLQRAAAAALQGPVTALRVCDVANKTVRLRVASAFVGYALALLIGIRWGLIDALWSLVLISAVETAAAWWIWLKHSALAMEVTR